jgi:hypothetical protein
MQSERLREALAVAVLLVFVFITVYLVCGIKPA